MVASSAPDVLPCRRQALGARLPRPHPRCVTSLASALRKLVLLQFPDEVGDLGRAVRFPEESFQFSGNLPGSVDGHLLGGLLCHFLGGFLYRRLGRPPGCDRCRCGCQCLKRSAPR